jgi:CheY-like chemotaxis protein
MDAARQERGIAHDFNNLLTVILHCSELALADSASEEHVRSNILEIQQAAQRAAILVKNWIDPMGLPPSREPADPQGRTSGFQRAAVADDARTPSGAASKASAPGDDATASAQGELILLVEDELRVRAMVRAVLLRWGYRVLDASSAEEALAIFLNEGARIDLVLSDVALGKSTGSELVQRLRALRADLRVLLMSGYAGKAVMRHGGMVAAGVPFLEKPFTLDDMGRKVREVLGPPRAR